MKKTIIRFTVISLLILLYSCASWQPFPIEQYNIDKNAKGNNEEVFKILNNYNYASDIFGFRCGFKNQIQQGNKYIGEVIAYDSIVFNSNQIECIRYGYLSGKLYHDVSQRFNFTDVKEIWITPKKEMTASRIKKCYGDYVITFQRNLIERVSVVITEDKFKNYLTVLVNNFPTAKILNYKQPPF
jgi:hypothetical protein